MYVVAADNDLPGKERQEIAVYGLRVIKGPLFNHRKDGGLSVVNYDTASRLVRFNGPKLFRTHVGVCSQIH